MGRRNRLTLSEQETIITWDNALDTAGIYTHDRKIKNKLERLAGKYPGLFRLTDKGEYGSVTYEIPKRCVAIHPPYSKERRRKQAMDAASGALLFGKGAGNG